MKIKNNLSELRKNTKFNNEFCKMNFKTKLKNVNGKNIFIRYSDRKMKKNVQYFFTRQYKHQCKFSCDECIQNKN